MLLMGERWRKRNSEEGGETSRSNDVKKKRKERKGERKKNLESVEVRNEKIREGGREKMNRQRNKREQRGV